MAAQGQLIPDSVHKWANNPPTFHQVQRPCEPQPRALSSSRPVYHGLFLRIRANPMNSSHSHRFRQRLFGAVVGGIVLLSSSLPQASQAAEALEDQALAWLQEFVQIDTVNPPGNESRAVD